MRTASPIGRMATFAAAAVAIVAVAVIITSGGKTFEVHALFQNASQLVKGDTVQVAGASIGTVSKIELTPNGQADLTLDITDPTYQPLHQGSTAVIRAASLSGIANRYVDLRPGPSGRPRVPEGSTIPASSTTSAVDLDQIFNTLDSPTRKGLQNFIQGSAISYAGKGARAQAGYMYLNPSIASTSAFFRELDRDTTKFTGFIENSSKLVSDIAVKSVDLSALIDNLNGTTSALAAKAGPLSTSIQRLPGFLSQATGTFANLRGALDDLTPLVDDSKPVAPKLRRLLLQLRPLARDAVPTIRALSNIIQRRGPNNDLIELTKLGVPLAAATVRNINVNGRSRLGALPQSVLSLKGSTPELAIARPYAVDLTGWFEGFTHPGVIDANGGTSRVAPNVGAFSLSQQGNLNFIDPAQRLVNAFGTASATGGKSNGLLVSGQGDRCPGSMERGGLFYPYTGFPCDPNEQPTGP